MHNSVEKRVLVISGINIYTGGALSVFYDCLDAIVADRIFESYRVVIFVHDKKLFVRYSQYVEVIEKPESRKNYLCRLWFEFVYFRFFSKRTPVFLWLSLHDITPNVIAQKRYVYCHNPSPFARIGIKDFFKDPRFSLFNLFYMNLYRINIQKNTAVIVQQNWIRDEFLKRTKAKKVLVAKPDSKRLLPIAIVPKSPSASCCFFYPALPRSFKNIEVICEAVRFVPNALKYDVFLTINGKENRYAKSLFKKYGNLPHLHFMGSLSRERVFQMYSITDCLVFPSKLETWGLPISEFAQTGRPIILADLPYAHETLGFYKRAAFFDQASPRDLSILMIQVIKKEMSSFRAVSFSRKADYDNWGSLIEGLLAKE